MKKRKIVKEYMMLDTLKPSKLEKKLTFIVFGALALCVLWSINRALDSSDMSFDIAVFPKIVLVLIIMVGYRLGVGIYRKSNKYTLQKLSSYGEDLQEKLDTVSFTIDARKLFLELDSQELVSFRKLQNLYLNRSVKKYLKDTKLISKPFSFMDFAQRSSDKNRNSLKQSESSKEELLVIIGSFNSMMKRIHDEDVKLVVQRN